jgi:hypothetical protein
MTFERKVLISILKLTQKGQTTIGDISENAGTPLEETKNLLKRYSNSGYFHFEETKIVTQNNNRVQLAVGVFELGADLEQICTLLGWKEFETISAIALESNGFSVKKNYRFKGSNRRWEIDLLGTKKPLVLSIDCKHWNKNWSRSTIKRVVDSQIERTKSLMEASDLNRKKIGILEWKKAVFVPVIISLIPGPFKFYRKTPVIPVLKIRNFLDKVFAYTHSLKHFSKKFDPSINEY